jgi:hypothetical protein
VKTIIQDFLTFLAEEYSYLTRIKVFLLKVPELITSGQVNELEFQNFLEKYELETSRFLYEKNRFKEEIARELNLPIEQVTFRRLVNLGYRGFEDKGRRVLKVSNEISLLLLKISIYLKNFARMQNEFRRLNTFLYQHDYSARGTDSSYSYTPGRNFHGEA